MKAAVFHKPKDIKIDTIDDPHIEDSRDVDEFITHKLPLSEASHVYDIFNNKEDDCVKVVLKP